MRESKLYGIYNGKVMKKYFPPYLVSSFLLAMAVVIAPKRIQKPQQ